MRIHTRKKSFLTWILNLDVIIVRSAAVPLVVVLLIGLLTEPVTLAIPVVTGIYN